MLLDPAPNPQSSKPSPTDRYKAGERDMAAMQPTRNPQPKGTSHIKRHRPLGPYSSPMSRALWWSWWLGIFLTVRYPCKPESADRYKAGERDMAAMQHQVIVEYDQATSPNPSTLNLEP